MPGRVFIGEDFDDACGRCSGRWSAFWESEDPKGSLEGPTGLSARDAIAWGREHAAIVLVRPGDSDIHYSAGSVADPDCPRWPEDIELPRRRHGERPDGWPSLPPTRYWSAARLIEALNRVGAGIDRIDLPHIWPTIAEWWAAPVADLGPGGRAAVWFELAPAPAGDQRAVTSVAGTLAEQLAGRDLVRLDFSKRFERVRASRTPEALSGGASLTLWFAVGDAWIRLCDRSDPIGIAPLHGGGAAELAALVTASGVLDAAAASSAVALRVADDQDHWRLSITMLPAPG